MNQLKHRWSHRTSFCDEAHRYAFRVQPSDQIASLPPRLTCHVSTRNILLQALLHHHVDQLKN